MQSAWLVFIIQVLRMHQFFNLQAKNCWLHWLTIIHTINSAILTYYVINIMFDSLLFINQPLNTFVATSMGPNHHVVSLVSFGCT